MILSLGQLRNGIAPHLLDKNKVVRIYKPLWILMTSVPLSTLNTTTLSTILDFTKPTVSSLPVGTALLSNSSFKENTAQRLSLFTPSRMMPLPKSKYRRPTILPTSNPIRNISKQVSPKSTIIYRYNKHACEPHYVHTLLLTSASWFPHSTSPAPGHHSNLHHRPHLARKITLDITPP